MHLTQRGVVCNTYRFAAAAAAMAAMSPMPPMPPAGRPGMLPAPGPCTTATCTAATGGGGGGGGGGAAGGGRGAEALNRGGGGGGGGGGGAVARGAGASAGARAGEAAGAESPCCWLSCCRTRRATLSRSAGPATPPLPTPSCDKGWVEEKGCRRQQIRQDSKTASAWARSKSPYGLLHAPAAVQQAPTCRMALICSSVKPAARPCVPGACWPTAAAATDAGGACLCLLGCRKAWSSSSCSEMRVLGLRSRHLWAAP